LQKHAGAAKSLQKKLAKCAGAAKNIAKSPQNMPTLEKTCEKHAKTCGTLLAGPTRMPRLHHHY
jgi:hypothetical protein